MAQLEKLEPPHGYLAATSLKAQARFGDCVEIQRLATSQIEKFLVPAPPRRGTVQLLNLLARKDQPIAGALRNPLLLGCLRELSPNANDLLQCTEADLLGWWLDQRRCRAGIDDNDWRSTTSQLQELALRWAPRLRSSEILPGSDRPWLESAILAGVLYERGIAGDSFVRFRHAKFQAYFLALALRQAWRVGGGVDLILRSGCVGADPLPLLMALLEKPEQERFLEALRRSDEQRALACLRTLPRKEALELAGAYDFLRLWLDGWQGMVLPLRRSRLEAIGHLDPRLVCEDSPEAFGDLFSERGTPYRLAKYPVTQLAFGRFVGAGGYEEGRYWKVLGATPDLGVRQPKYWLSEGVDQPNAPVVGVSVYDALAYCEWLNSQPQSTHQGKVHFALPTLHQSLWARYGGVPGVHDVLSGLRAQNADNASHEEVWPAIGASPMLDDLIDRVIALQPELEKLAPVGWTGYEVGGCFDLEGGIWEWCDSWILQQDGLDRPSRSPERHPTWVVGGACRGWFDPTSMPIGGWFDPYLRFERIGFRIARIERPKEL